MSHRILITRPAADAAPFAEALAAAGIAALTEPMMTIETFRGPALDLAGVQGVLATSANGARALAARTPRRDVPLFAVGDATARAAEALGFTAVISAAGDVTDLAALVMARCDPAAGVLLHAAGTTLAGDLGATLAAAGFRYRRESLYAARPVAALSATARTALAAGRIDGVALFSPRTARILVDRAAAAGCTANLASVDAFCLSAAVGDAAAAAVWRRILVARDPTGRALRRLVIDTLQA